MMAEKEHQSPHPLVPSNPYGRSDTEAATSADARKKKRAKCLLYIVLFAVFQAGVILIFALTIMKIRTPKFRISSAALENFTATAPPANPSFSGRMTAELGVKNNNFGRFKYQNATVYFYYRGTQVGEVTVGSSRAKWRSTRKIDVAVDLRFASGGEANTELASDLNAGVVPVTSQAKLRGKVELMFVMKKNRSTDMNCSMEIVTANQLVQNIVCK